MLLMWKCQSFDSVLSVCKSKLAILSIIPPYDEKYVPQTMTEVYPKMLPDFHDPLKEDSLNHLKLCNLGNNLDINVSLQHQS